MSARPSDDELPGMWSHADFMGDEPDARMAYERVIRNLRAEYPMDAKVIEAYVAKLRAGIVRLAHAGAAK